MAENLVWEEYAVNYQNNKDVLGNGDTEESPSDQVSKCLSIFGIG